jgi:hypothetical protein
MKKFRPPNALSCPDLSESSLISKAVFCFDPKNILLE